MLHTLSLRAKILLPFIILMLAGFAIGWWADGGVAIGITAFGGVCLAWKIASGGVAIA